MRATCRPRTTVSPTDGSARQLALSFTRTECRDFEHFVAGAYRALVDTLRGAAARPSAVWPLVWGPSGSGKTHLLVAASAAAAEARHRAIYLDCPALLEHGPDALEAADGAEFVAFDGIDRLFGDDSWEESLFHRFNRLHRSGAGLVMSASVAPAAFEIGLQDLRSRLNWGTTHALFPLDDDNRRELVRRRGLCHGIELAKEVVDYLMRRSRRAPADLARRVDDIAAFSVAEKRRVTVPLVREVLGTQGSTSGGTSDATPSAT